jgi:hypothetical protein
MTWFKVDDKLHSHSKTRKVLAEAPAALALWVVAGSWSSDNLTDGFVPDHQLPWLIPDGAEGLARQLVAARFWKRVKGGYQFHQWATDGDGARRNPTRAEVEADRNKKAEAGRKGGLARARNAAQEKDGDIKQALKEVIHKQKPTPTDGSARPEIAATSGKARSKPQARAEAGALQVVEPPTRPDPTFIGGALSGPVTPAREEPPPPRCPEHQDHPDPPPCGACAEARRARTRWDLADAERRRTQPHCRRHPSHRGQPADRCGLCRSEQLGAEEAS